MFAIVSDIHANLEAFTAVLAEIIRQRWGGSGQPLALTEGPVHHDARTR